MRPQPTVADALIKLPGVLALTVRMKLKTAGFLGPLCITGEEMKEIIAASGMEQRQIMVALLDIASALSTADGEGNHIGAVIEGETGGLYIGAPTIWQNKPLKFSAHGIQSGVMSAWQQGEMRLRSVMVETQPCACCRQFLRETWNWTKLKIIHAADGPGSWKTGAITEIPLSMDGLKADDLKGRLMGEAQRNITLSKADTSDLVNLAADAASMSYAPYSKNYAGVALRTKKGVIFQGRYAECSASIAGILAVEAALINMALSGIPMNEVTEAILVETRGT
ncbi:MAG TPA: cytidine deaminase, partial [Alphaproteobacteria bacterium]|nr:cytidine deaminase [Alphaproteobacteria bacterium]